MLRRSTFFYRVIPALVTACLAFTPAVTTAQAKSPIEVGVAVSLTGYLATSDVNFVNGVKLGVQRVNARGGIDGHPVNLHIVDNASNVSNGVTVTNQLLNQGVTVMINGLLSGQNAAIEPILARNKVPQIDYSDSPPTWAYMVNVPHDKHSEMQLRFAVDKLHAKTIALLYSQTPYGQLGAKQLVAQAQAMGLKIVQQVGVDPTLTDLTPLMASVKDAKPDAVVDILTGATHIVEAKAATTVGLKVPLIMVADDVVTLQKVAAEYPDIYFTVQPPQAYPSVPNPQLKASIAAFLAAYRTSNLDPAGLLGAASGWDAVSVLEEAVKQAGGNTGGDALNAGFQKVTLNGCNSVFRYTAADHTGQASVANPIQVANLKGSAVNVVFSVR